MERREALRALIDRVDRGEAILLGDWLPHREFYPIVWHDASRGSLDAVARLEAPLRERGWIGPFVAPSLDGDGIHAEWGRGLDIEPEGTDPIGVASTEARARLCAVLCMILREEESTTPENERATV